LNRGDSAEDEANVVKDDTLGGIYFNGKVPRAGGLGGLRLGAEIEAVVDSDVGLDDDLPTRLDVNVYWENTKYAVTTFNKNAFKLNTGTQLQDANNTNLVIYDSSGAVLWGNV